MSKTFVLLFILCFHRLLAQTSSEFTLLSTDQGLSQGMVFDILQDRNGFIWVATKNGLNRYDGYQFQIYTHDPFDRFSLASSEIRKLFEDSRGRIWVAHSSGLDLFVPQTGLFFHLKPHGPTGFDEDQDYRSPRFAELPDGTVWAVDSSKIWKFEVPEGVLEKAAAAGNAFPDLPYQVIEARRQTGQLLAVTSILLSQNRTLLVGTTQGFYRLNPASGQMTLEGLPDARVFIIGEERSGHIWLEGVWYKTMGSVTVYFKYVLISWLNGVQQGYPVGVEPSGLAYQRPVFQLDEEGFLWRLWENKLVKAPAAVLAAGGTPAFEWTFTDALARNPYFYLSAFVVDRSGIVWLGTSGFGVIKVNLTKPKFSSYLPYTTQRQIFEDPQGQLFTSMDESRLYLSEKLDRYKANFWLPDTSIWGNYSIVFDTAGCSWYNLGDGILHRFDVRTRQRRSFPWQGFGLVRTKDGKLYSAGETGLQEFNPRTEKSAFYPFGQPQKSPGLGIYSNYLYEGADNTLWIFGFEGLIRASAKSGDFQFSHFKNNPDAPNTLSNNSVLCVLDDPLAPARFLWVGTKGGLNRLDKQTGDFKHYKTAQGLPDDVVYGILPDDNGHIWLSTNKGLCRFHVREETTKNFTVADGLQNNEFNQSSYLKTRNGALIFGGVNGLTVFHPDSLRFNEHLPQTRIVGIKVNNKSLAPGEATIRQFAHDQNFLTLEFAALEFSNPAQNRYRYSLLRHGFFDRVKGDSWVDLGEKNVVQFANLSPGTYTFRVLGSNNDGFWSQQPAEFHFEIRPPWWASWWAYLLYAGVVAGLIWWIYRYQLRQKLEHQETRRLRELDEFKSRFFTNITHEFRTPLTVILGISEQWLKEEPDEPKRSKLELVKRNGANLLRLINQIMDLAKLESSSLKINYVHGDVSAYLRYIVESLHSFANAQNVMLRMEIPGHQGQIMMDYDPERLLQIVYNLLSNAIKFTPSGGQVILTALPSDTELQLSVADTGAGISPEELPLIFDRFYQANNLEKAKAGGTGIGLALTKELVKAMGGEISVKSEVGKGTTFTVTLPITNKANQNQPENLPEHNKQPMSANAPSRPGATTGNQQPTTKNQLLLIEDNPDVVEYLVACLQEQYALNFAYNGRAGIEMALETIPDLIISDVMMPEKDGFEVCEALKNDERTSHIPIVLLTAKAGVENRIAGLRRGADAYLSKPFHQEELLVVLANLLEGRRKLQAKYRELPAPDSAVVETATPDPEDLFLRKVRLAILEHLHDSSFSVDALCRVLAMSQPQLHRKLSALTGTNATLYMRAIRLTRAKELLLAGEKNVSEVAFEVGFDDPKYFSRVFAEMFGVPPSKI